MTIARRLLRPSSRPSLRSLSGMLLATALLVAGCAEAEGPSPDPPDTLPSEIEEMVLARGGPAADNLAQGLVSRLTAAMDEGGTVHAVEFCAEEAIPLTREIEAEVEGGMELKRATLRWRNPDNAPDEWERRVLEYLTAQERDGEGAPGELVAAGPGGTLRYYRTLRTAPLCLSCHGDEASMDPEVLQAIDRAYPEDRARGYEEGEFRGVIRVQFPVPGETEIP
jgi:hypothetical protein